MRDQFVVGVTNIPVRRALQEGIRMQPAIYFHDTVVDAAVWDQEDAEATVAVTKR